jgi:DNA-binding NarL/FixJ family response regulator
MRILLADDSGLLRDSLSALMIHLGHEVVAAVGTAEELVVAARRDLPEIVVTDVRMPPTFTDEGLRAAATLRREHVELPVMVLSQYIDTTSLADLLGAGGAGTGYLLKDRVADGARFVADLREVAAGGTVIDQDVVRRLMSHARDPLRALSVRELDVLRLMAQGRSNAAIAAELVIADATVSKHIGSIFDKLALHVDGAAHRRVLAVLTYLRGQ